MVQIVTSLKLSFHMVMTVHIGVYFFAYHYWNSYFLCRPITILYICQVSDEYIPKLAVFIVFCTESENPLAEADIEIISGNQLEIFCSRVVDCLALTYDCLNSGILYSLYIHSNNTKVMRIAANRPYSIAFFGISNYTDSLDRPLERHPGKVMSDVGVHPEESSAASTSIDSVFLCSVFAFSYTIALCFWLCIYCPT